MTAASSSVRVQYVTCSVPKRGNQEQENEDAAWPGGAGWGSTGVFRCAVGDGATQAAFSREWAQALVEAYGKRRLVTLSDAHLAGLRRSWNGHYRNAELPWYLEEKVLRGSFAAFLGLEIRAPIGRTRPGHGIRRGHWSAVAVGDCCLFSVRRDSPGVRFPFRSPKEFGDTPYLVSTNAAPDHPLNERRQQTEGRWISGDTFYLLSDALAAWFLAQIVQGGRPWRALDRTLGSRTCFERFVSGLRAQGRIKNDDTTVTRIRVY